jgi:hypothetical protein
MPNESNGFDPANLPVTDVPIVPDPSKSKDDTKRRLFPGDRADDSPRARAAAAKARTKTKTALPIAASKPGYFIEPIQQTYGFIAMAIMPFDPVCANGLMLAAPGCAESWDNLATKNEAVRRMLFAITQTSALGLIITAHMPLIAAILMHHVPAMQNMMGTMGAEMAENIAKAMETQNDSSDD